MTKNNLHQILENQVKYNLLSNLSESISSVQLNMTKGFTEEELKLIDAMDNMILNKLSLLQRDSIKLAK